MIINPQTYILESRVKFFLSMFFLSSSPCHPHYGSGHHSQCSLQLPQQITAHYHDVKQCEYNAHRYLYLKWNIHASRSNHQTYIFFCFVFSLLKLKEACSRSLKRTTCSRCQTVVSGSWHLMYSAEAVVLTGGNPRFASTSCVSFPLSFFPFPVTLSCPIN